MSPGKIIKNLATSSSPVGGSITKRQIVDARVEAQRIVTLAEEDAAAIRESAEKFARETREAAYREGNESALLEWNTLLLETHQLRDQALANVEQDILKLAVKIAEKIIGHEINRDQTTIVDIVGNALRHARRNETLTVRINPADSPLVEKHRKKLDPNARAHSLDIVADPRVAVGGCVIESESGAIDAQLETQLRVLERALLTRTTSNEH